MLCWEQQQQLSSPLAGTKPCSSAKSQLKRLQTQRDGYDTDTDVRESHEIQEKVEKEPEPAEEATAAPSSRAQDENEFSKCECWRVPYHILVVIVHYFSVILFMK